MALLRLCSDKREYLKCLNLILNTTCSGMKSATVVSMVEIYPCLRLKRGALVSTRKYVTTLGNTDSPLSNSIVPIQQRNYSKL